ncbi:MAG TPA: hypothetical protein VGD78_09610 [Chthoniobacterales bacterium]
MHAGSDWKGKRTLQTLGLMGCLCLEVGCVRSRPCENLVREEDPSPDGRVKAVVFERRCPDLGQRTTQISILKRDGSLGNGNGNIFAADEPILVKVGWQGNGKLVVYSLADLTKGTRLVKAGDIAIEYEQMMETDLLAPLDSPGAVASPSVRTASPVPTGAPAQ